MFKSYRFNGYPVFWFVFLACFAAIGLRGFITSVRAPAIEGTGPYCSSNALLKEFFGFHGGSEKILDAFQHISPAQPSVVFWPEKHHNLSICCLITSYLAWPRRVEGMATNQEQLEGTVDQWRGKAVGGIWLCGLVPSRNLKNWIIVDRGLILVPAAPPR